MKSLFALHDETTFDDVCYLSQQCVEKLLKSICIEQDVFFPHSHDLRKLLELLLPRYPTLASIETELMELTRLGAEFRYPDDFATPFEAQRAFELCTLARGILLELLGPVTGKLFP